MDLNHLLLWIVGMSCTATLVRASSSRFQRNRGWAIIATAILGITLLALLLKPSHAGLLGGGLWFLFIFLPTLLMHQVSVLAAQERFPLAQQVATCISWLHPIDGWREYPHVLNALALAQKGDSERAIAILRRFQNPVTPVGRIAAAAQYRIEARWEALLEWIYSHGLERWLPQDGNLALIYMRSLGETGELNTLVHTASRLTPTLERAGAKRTLAQMQLLTLTFCGQPEAVRSLLKQSLSGYPPLLAQFWLAIAETAAGHSPYPQEHLQQLQTQADAITQRAIAYRLSHPPVVAKAILTESSQNVLSQIKTDIWQEHRYGNPFTYVSHRAYATYSLIGVNVLLFAVAEIIGSSQNPTTLVQLGALVPAIVWQGEWWRLLTANFLHLGVLHLGMNMVGLYFLGGFVESTLGRLRLLTAYFGSGLGTMLLITLLAIYTRATPQILVGASAAIMGLVGVLAAIMLQGWKRERSRIAAKNLRLLIVVLAVQTLFDLTTPGISFSGHILGFLLGSIVGYLLLLGKPIRR